MIGTHYFIHTNTLTEIADLFNLSLSTPITQAPTWYADNPDDSNSVINLIVINLMFLWSNSSEFNNHLILLDL